MKKKPKRWQNEVKHCILCGAFKSFDGDKKKAAHLRLGFVDLCSDRCLKIWNNNGGAAAAFSF
jgi:predicted nucleic acid-binding Zn ribbon protein